MTPPPSPSFLERFGLHRPELRAWAMYDWANSAFYLVIVTAVFPIFYQQVAATGLDGDQATFRFAMTTAFAMTAVALTAPVLGALADFLAWRKRLMAGFVALGVLVTMSMYLIHEGDWLLATVLFGIGNFAVATSFVFYDSFLPHIARGDEMDRVSTAGYALGYLGSGLLLIVFLPGIQESFASTSRLAFVGVAVWWGVFALPLFLRVPEPPRLMEADELDAGSAMKVSFHRLAETFHELRGSYRQAFMMLLAMLIYNDGIGTIIRMAGIYAASRDVPQKHIVAAILLVQFVGIPCAFLFGYLAGKFGAKRSILFALGVFTVVCVVAFNLETTREWYIIAVMVGAVQGGAQALSRSLFASLIPKHKAAEFFGFFSVFEKFAGIFGPLIFGWMIVLTGSTRGAILSVIAFFVVGGAILASVKVEEGRREAREMEERLLA
ncbi:MAG: MFS transporter [bacterium]|nr:MFS transporter [bacterium]